MRVVIDVEADALHSPTRVWCIVLKDIDKEHYYVFSDEVDWTPSKDNTTRASLSEFNVFGSRVKLWVGHNLLGWDYPTLERLGYSLNKEDCLDTLILSRMIDYPRTGHSIEDYGLEFGIEKGKHHDFSKFSQGMEDYCIRDVDICHRIFDKYKRYINNGEHRKSIRTEHAFQFVVNDLERRGFAFDRSRCASLLDRVVLELEKLDKEISDVFRPRLVYVKEVTPRLTKLGTLNRADFRFVDGGDLSEFNGGPFCRCRWRSFNASSHRQIVDVLNAAGWRPTDRTKAHIEALRSSNQRADRAGSVDIQVGRRTAEDLSKYGWKINEQNLGTLPNTAPLPARKLASRILLEARRRTLVEWSSLVKEDERIHGKYYGIGTWTHRMAHQAPNTANIPTGNKLYGERMRSLWRAPRNRLLVGVDAEGIQLRIFAHYINDEEFTNAIVCGEKSRETDPHSLNKSILGDVCRSRDVAKRYIYALLLGAGHGKLCEILGSDEERGRRAYDNLIRRYVGLATLKTTIIPADARRGWFVGLDGRRVRIPGETRSERGHLCMSGYLQNGEAVIMKMACLKWIDKLEAFDAFLVNFVHDEWQTECPNDLAVAEAIAKLQADSLTHVGEELGLRCPLAGSYNIGLNWSETH